MSTPLAGKRLFYSMGVRSLSAEYTGPWPSPVWPEWSRLAFFRGQDDGRWARACHITKSWSAQKLADSIAAPQDQVPT